MNTLDLITAHLRLEGTGIDARGDLISIPCPNPDAVPRFYIAQHTDDATFSRFVRRDQPEELRRRLMVLPAEEALHCHEAVKRILALDRSCDEFHYGKSYLCPNSFVEEDFPNTIRLTEEHRLLIQEYDAQIDASADTVFAVVVDGQIVSTCQSARENETAAEAWVRTLPAYRRRGFARQTTAAWAPHVWAYGKLPFYSHRMDNPASQGVARSLGLELFIVDAAYR